MSTACSACVRGRSSRRRAGVAMAVAGLAAVAVALPAPATATTRAAGSRMTAVGTLVARDCIEPSAIVTVAPERAAALLPPGYVPAGFVGLPGEASALLGVSTCQSGTLDGRPLKGPFAFGERVLQVQPRDATPGLHFYAYEQVSDVPEIVTALRRAGFAATLDRTVGGTQDGLGAASAGGSVHVAIAAGVPFPSPLSRVSIWRESERGTARLDLEVDDPSAEAGVGQVTAAPGSPTFRLIGGPKATGIGAINHFSYTGTIRAERPAPAGPTLTATPTCVVSGRTAMLALRATADGDPAAGTVVRYGSGATVLDADGRGALRIRGRGRGTRSVRARLPDGRTATVPLRIVRRASGCPAAGRSTTAAGATGPSTSASSAGAPATRPTAPLDPAATPRR